MFTQKNTSAKSTHHPPTSTIRIFFPSYRSIRRDHLLYASYLLCLFFYILIEGGLSLTVLFIVVIIGHLALNIAPEHRASVPAKMEAPQQLNTGHKRIALRTANGFEFVKQADIICIQGGGNGANFIKVYREGQAQPIIVSQTLSFTLKMLSENEPAFRQFHKSYIIDIRKISRLCKDEDGCTMAVMDNDVKVPIPADKVAALKSSLGLE